MRLGPVGYAVDHVRPTRDGRTLMHADVQPLDDHRNGIA